MLKQDEEGRMEDGGAMLGAKDEFK